MQITDMKTATPGEVWQWLMAARAAMSTDLQTADTKTALPVEDWQGLMAAKEIIELARISRAHFFNMLSKNQFPQPALREGSRFTRWRAKDVQAWLEDPAAWIAANAGKSEKGIVV